MSYEDNEPAGVRRQRALAAERAAAFLQLPKVIEDLNKKILRKPDGQELTVERVSILLSLRRGPARPLQIADALGIRDDAARQRLKRMSEETRSGPTYMFKDKTGRYRLTKAGRSYTDRAAQALGAKLDELSSRYTRDTGHGEA